MGETKETSNNLKINSLELKQISILLNYPRITQMTDCKVNHSRVVGSLDQMV